MFTQSKKTASIDAGDDNSDNQDNVCLAATLLKIDRELEKGCAPVALGICNQAINRIMKDESLKNHLTRQQNYLEAIRAKLMVIQTMAALCLNQLYHYSDTNETDVNADTLGTSHNPIKLV
jgi:hypothetical protein